MYQRSINTVRSKKKFNTAFKIIISFSFTLLCYRLVFNQIEISSIFSYLINTNGYWLSIAIIVNFLTFLPRSLRWKVGMSPLGRISFSSTHKALIIGYSINNIFPFRIGEVTRAFLVFPRSKRLRSLVILSIIVDRFFDFLVLVLWACVICFIFGVSLYSSSLYAMGLILTSVITFGSILLIFTSRYIANFKYDPTKYDRYSYVYRLLNYFLQFYKQLEKYTNSLRNPLVLSVLFLLTNIIWLGEVTVFYFTAKSMSLDIPLIFIFLTVSISNLATSIPVSPGGFGQFEIAAKQILLLAGLGYSEAIAYSVLIHGVLIIPISIFGLILVLIKYLSPRTI